jgi:beta-glucanase (GH16 family)
MHTNGHEICGFYTLPLDEGTKLWHGHRDGSQLCEKVTPCVPTPQGRCDDVWDVAAPSTDAPSATCGSRVRWLMENWAGGMDRQEAEKSVGHSYAQCSTCKTERYDMIWNDEFTTWDSNKWEVKQWASGMVNKELQAYTKEPSNSYVRDGALHIVAEHKQYINRVWPWTPPSLTQATAQYTSARLESKLPTGSFKYGRFEIRAKLPTGDGTWPALWMLHTTEWYGRWPDSGEIDLMEHSLCGSPGVVKATVHTNGKNFILGTNPVGSWTLDPSVFHVYGLEWTPDELRVTVDGNQFFHYTKSGQWFDWPFDQPFHIILNVAVGGGFYAGCSFDPDLRCSDTYTSGGCRKVWNTNANGHTCGDRIKFVKDRDNISWAAAERAVGNEQSTEDWPCRPCAECQKMVVDWVRVYKQKP